MPDIDSLSIKISADATKASASLDSLSRKLDRVSMSLSGVNSRGLATMGAGVNKLANAMRNMKAVGTADFTRLAKNIQKLGQIDTTSIGRAASAMSQMASSFNRLGGVSANAQQVGVLASNLSKLGYKSINNAITNLPALTSGLNNLMVTLSRAPQVSNNVIQMTNALANLASQGGRVGTASRTLVNGLNRSTNAMNRAKKSSMSLAAAFGKFYATWFLAIRGIKKLWSSMKSSMDYVETLNYFNAAFDQVAQKADLSSFQSLGYKSADEYAKSFSERAKELTAQMTGFAVTDKGTLEATGMPSLGMNPSQLMQYQAMFGQMASSMGVASETSLKLSRALTEIGADLASVKNMDFDKVWRDMASGLAGMSRTLDKYGVNIRNVNLQQRLTELGINANITALNQNDKALLRAIILLDSTRYAWGDLADTINQPANQLRLINANFQNLSRIIGNLFLPIVQKVLPYINALVIALQRLFTWVGNFIGIEWKDWEKETPDNSSMSDLLDQTEELGAGLDKASNSAKKLKGNLQGFDKLNVITTKDDSSGAGAGAGLTGGLLDAAFEDALSEYQKKWDEAFANMENHAQELADGVEKAFAPIKKIIQDFAVGDFFQVGQDISNLVVSITDFFARAIDSVDWNGVGEKVGDFLAGIDWKKIFLSIGNFIEKAINAAIELWKGSFSADPIATTIITALGIAKFTGLGAVLGNKIASAIPTTIGIKSLTVVLAAVTWEIGFDVGKSLGKKLFPEDSQYYDDFTWFGKGGFFETLSNTDLSTHIDALGEMSNLSSKIMGAFGLSSPFTEVKESIEGLGFELETFPQDWEKAINQMSEVLGVDSEKMKNSIGELGDKFAGFCTNTGIDVENIKMAFETITSFISGDFKEDWEKEWNDVKDIFSGIWDTLSLVIKVPLNAVIGMFEGLANGVIDAWNGIKSVINTLSIDVPDWIPKIGGEKFGFNLEMTEHLNIPRFEKGGYFPKQYSIAMVGENGIPEVMGTVGGKSAVAGGAEITGIRDAVYSTSQQEVELLKQQNQILQAILEKEFGITRDEIGKSAQSWARDYSRRTGRPAYSF